jgi:DNA-binding transcriptional MerR regulator
VTRTKKPAGRGVPVCSDAAIPEREAFRIGEVARIAGVTTTVLRYWESEFSRLRPPKTASGQRLYRRSDVLLVLRIRDLLHRQRFTLAGARRALAAPPSAAESAARRNAILDEVRRHAQLLLQLVRE